MDTHPYCTTLSDAEWALLQPLLPSPASTGRPRKHPLRTILDAIFYAVRAGHAWRLLPQEWPPWKTVYHYYRQWRLDGTWERPPHRPAGSAPRSTRPRSTAQRWHYRQSVGQDHRTGWAAQLRRGQEGERTQAACGFTVVVDTQGLVLTAVVHPAGLHDRIGAKRVLPILHAACPRLVHLWADQGYAGVLRDWAKDQTGIDLEVVYPWWRQLKRYLPDLLEDIGFHPGFHVLPRRWVVERTFAWLGRYRRLAKDYERLAETTQALIYIAMSRLMLRRLASP